jgi:protein TonB
MQSRTRLTVASALLHLAVLAIVLHVRRIQVEPTRFPGTPLGSHVSLTYSPGRAPSEASVAAVKPSPAKLKQMIKSLRDANTRVASTKTLSPPSANPNAVQGGDARGAGNATVALATFFPAPHPDLTQLPRGTRGDVIVDVIIDEQGKIVDSQVSQSMGSSIDQTVLATIATWTFKPATKDGVAVPSEQELLFHYERG